MVRQTLAALAFVALGSASDPGCGGVDGPDGGTNAPCTRSSDCGGSLVCSEGVCREPDAGGQVPNGSRDSGTEREASAPPVGDAGDDGG